MRFLSGAPGRPRPHGRCRLLPGFWVLLASLVVPTGSGAQDVEMLNQWYGNRPPDAYYETLARDPDAFQFSREGRARLEALRGSPRMRTLAPAGAAAAPARIIGPRDGPVEGTFRFPLILGLFADGPQVGPFSRDRVEEEFFLGPNSYHQTISEFYAELSGGRLALDAVVFDWVQTGFTRAEVTLNQGGLTASHTQGVGAFVESILRSLDASGVDWAQFDLSGDGYVDILTVMHPYRGRECTGDNSLVNSHRWSLERATSGRIQGGFVTTTPYEGGGFIRINDYTIQPLLDCSSPSPPDPGLAINRIGVFSHEIGHAFGLPDLYDVNRRHQGVGHWDLMASGAWGCGGSNAAFPCHMGAWTKSVLGWIEVEEVGADEVRSVLLEPVLLSERALRIPAFGGANEYLLLENRQRLGSDVHLLEPGMLIWHVDQDLLDQRWTENAVNTNAGRMGVRLIEADGQANLTSTGFAANRGDPGDPFPGCIRPEHVSDPFGPCTRNRSFHLGSSPPARSQDGEALGVALTGIELVGGTPHDVAFQMDTRFTWDTVLVALTIEAVTQQTVAVQVSGIPGPVLWRLTGGSLPPGLSYHPTSTTLTGTTVQTGSFEFVLSAADGINREVRVIVSLEVVPPAIVFEDLVAGYLGITPDPLTALLRLFLDQQGNQNGGFDLGDARAFIQAAGVGEGSVAVGAGEPDGEPGEDGPSAGSTILALRSDPEASVTPDEGGR